MRLSPPKRLAAAPRGTAPGGSRVHCDSLDGVGARLCPRGIAMSTPQAFLMASGSAKTDLPRSSDHPAMDDRAHRIRPISARLEPVEEWGT